MTHSIGSGAGGFDGGGLSGLEARPGRERDAAGPDPVVGAGLALLGIFVMAVAGARDAHYVFDAGVLVAITGAVTFVVCVALSAMKQRRAR